MIELKNVSLTYAVGTPFERKAVDNLSLTIEEKTFTAIAGHTGSGKSSLVQMIAGLIEPTSGQILIDEVDLKSENKIAVRDARRKIGMVFQYPEHQLFEETVEKDIAFGPRNFGCDEEEISKRVRESLELVGLDFETVHEKSPLDLSGGQRRRVAIAGVLALKPKYLIFDEPTAGLDPSAREQLLKKISQLKSQTIILISHSMDDIARLADRLIVLKNGHCLADDEPRKIFQRKDILTEAGLSQPRILQLLENLRAEGISVKTEAIRIDEGLEEISSVLKKSRSK